MSNVRLVMSIAQRYDNMGAQMGDLVQVIQILLNTNILHLLQFTYWDSEK